MIYIGSVVDIKLRRENRLTLIEKVTITNIHIGDLFICKLIGENSEGEKVTFTERDIVKINDPLFEKTKKDLLDLILFFRSLNIESEETNTTLELSVRKIEASLMEIERTYLGNRRRAP